MNDSIQLWLHRQVRRKTLLDLGTFAIALPVGLIVSFLTFWLVYAGIMMANGLVKLVGDLFGYQELTITHQWRLWLSGLFFLLLAWECARRPFHELGDYDGDFEGKRYRYHHAFDGWGVGYALLADSRASSKMIAEMLYFGPRLLQTALQSLWDIIQLQRLDHRLIADTLRYLAAHESAVSREELTVNLSASDARRLATDLRRIGGVVFLKKGVSLTMETREELQTLLTT